MIRTIRFTGFIGGAICGVCLAKVSAKADLDSATVSPMESDKLTPTADSAIQIPQLKLKQVQVFFRHGARTPLHLTPGIEEVSYLQGTVLKDVPHTVFKYEVVILPDMVPSQGHSSMEEHYQKLQLKGGGYAGNLTAYGQEMMYSFGKSLRTFYGDQLKFLPKEYNGKDIYVQSTNINRTVVSARCVLAGMFGKQSLNKSGPVQIRVLSSIDEILYPNTRACSVLQKANHAVIFHFDRIPGIKEDLEFIEKILGYDSQATGHKLDFVSLRDDFVARITHGYSIPENIVPYMNMIDKNATKILYYAMCGQHEAERPVVTRLAVGPALQSALDAMSRCIQGQETPKIYLYSTHDSTMVALLESTGLFNWQWPPFAADLRFELYEDDDKQHWVRVLYCGEEKAIRGCNKPLCKFEDFKQSLVPYTIQKAEYKKLCSSPILEQIAASLLQHDQGEVETPEIKELSEIPAGM
ncbi:hypothetical protein C0Q70_03200 [Pomacea canaliculata]|uniref:Lysophosphatidic acid phosphatase type 6 n=2 Tax=Pomacea canaliculata TaxID=400727 RepID=A0A2T7PS24_POMCA|nr:hypothetical protein C0Q70_03200 [Pomacea canaliculata]